ncbi:MAG: hypothetical protein R2849_04975 [Thermomicrobiales bacterium]
MAMHSAYRKQRNTIAATYSSSVKADVFMARTRHYESALDAALKPKNILESVYDALVESVNDHLPLLHRYIYRAAEASAGAREQGLVSTIFTSRSFPRSRRSIPTTLR